MEPDAAAHTAGNLYLPCVLQRLTDLNPESRVERYPRAVSILGLRKSVLANVSMLLNSASHLRPREMKDPTVADSVLGLGLSDFCGLSHGREQRERLRRDILHQLAVFEPRLDRSATEVSFISEDDDARNGILELEIRSLISVEPLKEEFAFRARLNLESGEAVLEE